MKAKKKSEIERHLHIRRRNWRGRILEKRMRRRKRMKKSGIELEDKLYACGWINDSKR